MCVFLFSIPMLIITLLLGIGRGASALRGAPRRAERRHVRVGGAELIEGPNVGSGDGIGDGAGVDQGPGVGTGNGPELPEVPGVGIGDGSGSNEGPTDCVRLRDGSSDGMFA